MNRYGDQIRLNNALPVDGVYHVGGASQSDGGCTVDQRKPRKGVQLGDSYQNYLATQHQKSEIILL